MDELNFNCSECEDTGVTDDGRNCFCLKLNDDDYDQAKDNGDL